MKSKHGIDHAGVELLADYQMLNVQCRDPYLSDGRSYMCPWYAWSAVYLSSIYLHKPSSSTA